MSAPTNSSRIWALSHQLSAICTAPARSFDIALFSNLCIDLSRRLDCAIAYNEVPDRVSELPAIFKLACQQRNVCSLQAAVMVVMVSVKNACKAQWFSNTATRELLSLANEVASIFCTPEGFSCEQEKIISSVSQIMSRYYPWLKLGHILASVAIKPGFEACAVDFHISKNINCSALEKISLMVAMKDNIDTSSCIINPPEVNFLLNGVGLQGRVVDCMNLEPQLPTIVNPMLRYGTNLLQAIGHFDAHYIVLIAFMSVIRASDLPAPHNYVQSQATAVDSDAGTNKGPPKISLSCPISFTRIRKPVKGYLCKHLDCFDLSSYIALNSKRLSWRCPLCNKPVGYSDIRIDQKILKILQEVDEGVTNVIIHSDGSWKATSGSNDHNADLRANAFEGLQQELLEAPRLLTSPSNVCGFPQVDAEMISLDVDVPSVAGNPSQVNQNSATQVPGIPCSSHLQNSFGTADYNTRGNPEAGGAIHARFFGHFTQPPVLTDSEFPAANREQQAFLGTNKLPFSLTSAYPPLVNNLWLQQVLHRQMTSSGYGGYAVPRNVRRTAFMDSLPQSSSSPLPTTLTSASPARIDFSPQDYIVESQLQPMSNAQVQLMIGNNRAPVHTPGNAFSGSPGVQSPRQPQFANLMLPQIVSTPPYQRARTLLPPGASISNINPTRPSQLQASRPFSTAEIMNVLSDDEAVQRVTRTEDLLNVLAEQNWQPSGRMRGSLSGLAYNLAHDQFIIRPTQTSAPTKVPLNNANISPQLQVLLANRNTYTSLPEQELTED